MNKPTVVLGCGPAGLFAAQAISNLGGEVMIFSKKRPSHIYGAQYLHQPIPDLTNDRPDGYLEVRKLGTANNYARRVYNDDTTRTSWYRVRDAPIWNLRDAYMRAWERWEPQIVNIELGYEDVVEFTARFPTVISTIPRWAICYGDHCFDSMPIRVTHTFEYTGLSDFFDKDSNVMIYNGTEHGDWYRTSMIFGHPSTEYRIAKQGSEHLQHDKDSMLGFKVVGTTCDCHPNVKFAGRLGTWQRGVLTHHAFEAAVDAYSERMAI